MKKNNFKIKEVFEKSKGYIKFYARNFLKLFTFNYCILLLVFLGIIMISLSTYNVDTVKTISDIDNSLQNISFFKELFIVIGVVFLILISSVVPHFKVHTLIAAIYTYFISTKLYKVFTLSYSNNNLNLMIIGVVIILLGLSIVCSFSYKVNEIFTNKLGKKNKKYEAREFDRRYEKILIFGFFIIFIGIIFYSI